MIVGIHQPNYLPYLGFFEKIFMSDIFVILDDAQFSKGDFHNRNRIKTKDGPKWLTIPVKEAFLPINKTLINYERKIGKLTWNEYHLSQIRENYISTEYFSVLFPELERIYYESHLSLADLNTKLIKLICGHFKIGTPIFNSSSLNLRSKSTAKLVDICSHFNASTYLSGPDGPSYMNMDIFKKGNIQVVVQDFKHPKYNQCIGRDFIAYLSAIDLLFNTGEFFK